MYVSFDTNELTPVDQTILAAIAEVELPVKTAKDEDDAPAPTPAPKPKATPAPAKKATPAPKPKAAPEPEPEEDEDIVEEPEEADEVDRKTVSALATELVSQGKAPKVKQHLTALGVKRVSEVPDSELAGFYAAISKL